MWLIWHFMGGDLTPAGRTFLPEARRILHLAESAALSTRRTATGDAGSVAIGFTAAADYTLMEWSGRAPARQR
jgi:DNA-binding transcriptional LysR family regulator